MKILHASDLLIGLSSPHVAPIADRLRAVRVDTVRKVVALAAREKAEAIVLAGNTLADNRILHREIKELSSILTNSPVPVYVLPGINDPYTPDSPYRLHSELFQPPVRVLHDPAPVHLGHWTLYPCPVRSRSGQADRPTSWIPRADSNDGFRVGVACATDLGPVDSADLDYLAAGGRALPSHSGTTHWCGTHETADYGGDRGRVNVVTIEENSPVRVHSIDVGVIDWQHRTVHVHDAGILRAELQSMSEPDTTILRLTLLGQLPLPLLEETLATLASLSKRFLHVAIDDRVALAAETGDQFHHPILRSIMSKLVSQAEHVDRSVPTLRNAEPELARHAALRLLTIVQESDHPDLI